MAMNAQACRVLLCEGRIVARTCEGTHCHGLLRFHHRTTVLVGRFGPLSLAILQDPEALRHAHPIERQPSPAAHLDSPAT